MSEQMSQGEVERVFREIFPFEIFSDPAKTDVLSDLTTLNDHYRHLKEQGYSDEEIEAIFDLALDNGEAYEV